MFLPLPQSWILPLSTDSSTSAVPVSIIANGKKKVVYTTQQTVQGVVNDAGFDWKKMMPIEDGLMQVKEKLLSLAYIREELEARKKDH